jgi:hypothetical protein
MFLESSQQTLLLVTNNDQIFNCHQQQKIAIVNDLKKY